MIFRKKAILFIHGFVGGVYDYNNYPNELEVYRNFDVYSFTLPAHEKLIVSDVKYNEWLDESKRQIEFLINHGYKKIYVIGHSMGGVIAANLASNYKEVKKLVLVAPAFRYFYFKDGKFDLKNITNSIKGIPSLFKEESTDQVITRILKTPISTMMEFTKLVSTCQNDIKNVTCPTLIIHGTNDRVVPNEAVTHIYDNISSNSVKLIKVESLTHDCFTKKRKDEVKNIITSYLRTKPKKKKEIINI